MPPSSSNSKTCGERVRSAICTACPFGMPEMTSSASPGKVRRGIPANSSRRSSMTETSFFCRASSCAMLRSTVVLPLPGSPTRSIPMKCSCNAARSSSGRSIVFSRAMRRFTEVSSCSTMPCSAVCKNCPPRPARHPDARVTYPCAISVWWVWTEPPQRVKRISSICGGVRRSVCSAFPSRPSSCGAYTAPRTVNIGVHPTRSRTSCTCGASVLGSSSSGRASQLGRA